ncbi:hypothetical protein M422DRAFT_267061 [Sphaerobolus stellatus SS14]|uniref:Uncharacterized protein n=1 Tax=Sphaerobolus stellatus (strain SS14) TaxID=990650 RepID=A0A0C9U9N7_SPHS4|nr:hypothetical protein M422DRAFT_267061 [Sphaerobolus stellatus SS14]
MSSTSTNNAQYARADNGPNSMPKKSKTQDDQNKEDEKNKKQAEKDLEKSWNDRLQLISVITTFFAANEAQMLSITTPGSGDTVTLAGVTANACLAGALVFHSAAAIFSFVAAFVLVRFRLKEAKLEKKNPSDTEKQPPQGIQSTNPHIAMQRVGYRQKVTEISVA